MLILKCMLPFKPSRKAAHILKLWMLEWNTKKARIHSFEGLDLLQTKSLMLWEVWENHQKLARYLCNFFWNFDKKIDLQSFFSAEPLVEPNSFTYNFTKIRLKGTGRMNIDFVRSNWFSYNPQPGFHISTYHGFSMLQVFLLKVLVFHVVPRSLNRETPCVVQR